MSQLEQLPLCLNTPTEAEVKPRISGPDVSELTTVGKLRLGRRSPVVQH